LVGQAEEAEHDLPLAPILLPLLKKQFRNLIVHTLHSTEATIILPEAAAETDLTVQLLIFHHPSIFSLFSEKIVAPACHF
jgi:hypothetical protein